MTKVYTLLSLLCLTFISFSLFSQCNNGRYRDKIFSVKTTTQVLYGTAPKYDGNNQNLYMDIFEPNNDNFAHRPLIILAFGGSFTAGVRQSPDILQLCNEFAQRGFVTVTIDYRIGKENGDDSAMYKAVLRGVQDMNGAVRYFYRDAWTADLYRIDTSQIFIGGTSAGAFIGIGQAYAKYTITSRPLPADFITALVSVGGADGTSGSPGYSTKVHGVIDLCGAVFDSIWIQPGDPMLVGVHGTADGTVPYYYDSIAGLTDIKSRFFGGGDIIHRYTTLGSSFKGYIRTFYGADHAPFVLPIPLIPPASLYMDTTIQVLQDFLYANVNCDSTRIAGVGILDPGYKVSVTTFPNPSDDAVSIISHESEDMLVKVYSVDGKLAQTFTLEGNSTHIMHKMEFSAGMFLLNYYDKSGVNKVHSEKVTFY